MKNVQGSIGGYQFLEKDRHFAGFVGELFVFLLPLGISNPPCTPGPAGRGVASAPLERMSPSHDMPGGRYGVRIAPLDGFLPEPACSPPHSLGNCQHRELPGGDGHLLEVLVSAAWKPTDLVFEKG